MHKCSYQRFSAFIYSYGFNIVILWCIKQTSSMAELHCTFLPIILECLVDSRCFPEFCFISLYFSVLYWADVRAVRRCFCFLHSDQGSMNRENKQRTWTFRCRSVCHHTVVETIYTCAGAREEQQEGWAEEELSKFVSFFSLQVEPPVLMRFCFAKAVLYFKGHPRGHFTTLCHPPSNRKMERESVTTQIQKLFTHMQFLHRRDTFHTVHAYKAQNSPILLKSISVFPNFFCIYHVFINQLWGDYKVDWNTLKVLSHVHMMVIIYSPHYHNLILMTCRHTLYSLLVCLSIALKKNLNRYSRVNL